MAKKHFDEYFNQVASDYHNMVLELKDMEKEFSEGLVSPEVYEQMKLIIQPIKRNYETLNYISYLLNMPVKKKKHNWYNRQYKNQLNSSLTNEDIHKENMLAMNELEHLFDDK